MMDIDLGGGEDENEGAEDWVQPSDGEPEIHKISLHCTGMDVMGELQLFLIRVRTIAIDWVMPCHILFLPANQETIVELVSFCQKALPPNLLPSGKSELSEQEIVAEQRREEETSITAQPAEVRITVHIESLRWLYKCNAQRPSMLLLPAHAWLSSYILGGKFLLSVFPILHCFTHAH